VFDKLVDLVTGWLDLFRFWVIVEPFEAGVVTRLGVFRREIAPGLHWLIPFGVDHALTEYTVPRTASLGDQSTTTRDGKNIGFHAVVTFKISNVQKALLEVHDVTDAIIDSAQGIVGTTLSGMSWEEIHNSSASEALTSACRKRAFRFGVEIQAVQLASLGIVRNIRLMQSGSTR
jgi:regulator of protease activity HflC (stomatin/prohibitin superfamily)